jgi:glycosyltransferase involved in cell wall biosynthesis
MMGPEELVYPTGEPYKLCTFSRVMQEKGIGDAVAAVKAVNESLGRTAYELDIYGQIDPNQQAWFAELEGHFPEYIRYCGCVPADQSTQILKNYFALLFPTYYEGEGYANTIVDAYASALPVIATDWHCNSEIITHGSTGFLYDVEQPQMLKTLMEQAMEDPEGIARMKRTCLEEVKKYSPEVLMQTIDRKIREVTGK